MAILGPTAKFNSRQYFQLYSTIIIFLDELWLIASILLHNVVAATQSGSLYVMLTFAPDTNSSCIDFTILDDIIALEDPEEFILTLEPPAIPRVELLGNTTRVVIIDDDRELPDIALIISKNT